MATRTVFGTMRGGDGAPLAGAKLQFRLKRKGGYDADSVYLESPIETECDEDGGFAQELFPTSLAIETCQWQVTFPDGWSRFFELPDGVDPIELSTCLGLTAEPNQTGTATLCQNLVNAHAAVIATTLVLGHIRPDGTTIIVNPTTGVASAVGGGGGAVASVFGRTGTVVAIFGDYDASEVLNDSGLPGMSVADALNALNAAKAATSHTHAASAIVSGTLDLDRLPNLTVANAKSAVILQGTTPGTEQTGHTNVSGWVLAGNGFDTKGAQFHYDDTNVNLRLGTGGALSGSAITALGIGTAVLGGQSTVVGYAASAFDTNCTAVGFGTRADAGSAFGHRASSENTGDIGMTARNLDVATLVLQRGSVTPYGSNKNLTAIRGDQWSGTLGRLRIGVFDGATIYDGFEVRAGAGAEPEIAFFGGTPVARPTISGSRGGNAALADLLTKLASTNLFIDATTA